MHRGDAKITFGTGGMLDVTLDTSASPHETRGPARHVPDRRLAPRRSAPRGAIEAIMLAAGTNVQWLRDDLGLIESADESHALAARAPTAAASCSSRRRSGSARRSGTTARAARCSDSRAAPARAEIVRAVLEGIAHRGADLVEAAEADAGVAIPTLRVDGGMTDNPTFVQALADATQRPVEISPVREATALGAALMAGLAVGHHATVADLARTWMPRARIEPRATLDRDQWREAVQRSGKWIPTLSGIDF